MRVEDSQFRDGAHSSDTDAAALRADARHNRQRIIDASRELFSSHGLDVPMKVIARRADVGMATLYRRFPTRQDLLAEVFAEQFAQCAAIVEAAVANPDPWQGLRSGVEGLAAMQAADHGFSAAFVRDLPTASMIEQKLQEGMRGFEELIERAKASGQLRTDFTFEDLVLVLMANSGAVAHAKEAAAAASKRLVAFLLESFHTAAVEPSALPPAIEAGLSGVVFPDPDQ
ncbi:TetR/AcrR family transcriptional regulator [Kutzneria sp. NPDC051319]|uniref:TetR/AcrR family transcriptional regulator n=1 Tax=Kutzneria sp. NPDC051319 TaxID=3155047 RepID=UPI003436409D